MTERLNYDEEIMHDERMIRLLWTQHKERSELSARHAQRFVQLALVIRKETQRKEAEGDD